MSRDPGVFDQDLDNPYRAPVAEVGPRKPAAENLYTGYAGFWVRFAAAFIDNLLVQFASILITMVFVIAAIVMTSSRQEPFDESNPLFLVVQILSVLVSVLFSFSYHVGMTSSSTQATLGKMAMGLKVTDLEGRRLSFGHALGRELSKILSRLTLGIGYIIAGFDDRKQALHDKVASTFVLKTR